VSQWLLLWREALLDALRRRLVFAIGFASLVSLMVLDKCAGCAPVMQVNGQVANAESVAPAIGVGLLVVVGLWVVTLAGLLASDHLAQTLEDGHAAAVLARPVRRDELAFARLAGSLTVSLAAGALLLGASAFWIATRNALPIGPALLASLACALACVTVSAFAMAASLALPRLAVWLLVFGLVFFTTLATGISAAQAMRGEALPAASLLGLLHRFGPPIASGMLPALAGWLPQVTLPSELGATLVRGVVWAALGLATLAAAFRRVELK
jgi:ABC-type transport system involved in multi-copper enzyme maturation permease subunit